jgi:hypothetical protein
MSFYFKCQVYSRESLFIGLTLGPVCYLVDMDVEETRKKVRIVKNC